MQDSTRGNHSTDSSEQANGRPAGQIDDKTVAHLNHLIQLNMDAQAGYETAAEHVEHEEYRRLLREYASQRAQFADELSQLVRGQHKEAEDSATLGGLLHQAWIDLKAALTNGDGAILAECQSADGILIRAYQDAIGEILAEPLLVILRAQFSDIRNAYERMRALSAALNQ